MGQKYPGASIGASSNSFIPKKWGAIYFLGKWAARFRPPSLSLVVVGADVACMLACMLTDMFTIDSGIK